MTKYKKYTLITILTTLFLYTSYGVGSSAYELGFTLLQSASIGSFFGIWGIGILVGAVLSIIGILSKVMG